MTEHVAVILLAHNEADTIEREIRSFNDVVVKRLDDAEFIVAEDGSRDGTRARIENAATAISLRAVGGAERLGYARAVEGALRSVNSDWYFLCDGGMKHDPEDFWTLWNARTDHDLIVGRKTNRQDQRYRQLLTFGFNWLIRQMFGVEVFDVDSGMRLLRRNVVDDVLSRGISFRNFSSSEIVLRAIASGRRYVEVPISYQQRAGESRGLPTRGLPKAIRGVVSDLVRLRRELRGR